MMKPKATKIRLEPVIKRNLDALDVTRFSSVKNMDSLEFLSL